ncbi:protein translocase subunit secY/sec61 alpha [Lachnospiraceae bacterium XBB1006]|nr:protein translocase subunit secY/sec61 alpha [Lachnospiraceae bacterium XBB1006]
MLETLRGAFKVKELRVKLFFTFCMLVVIRVGSQIPLPGVDAELFQQWFANNTGDSFGFMNAITGGSFEKMSVFALSITPYITSSIIMQLLTIAIPALSEMQMDGEEGRKKIVSITRYVTVGLSLIESIAMSIGFSRMGYVTDESPLTYVSMVVGLTAGSAVLMWIGERITEKGVGNGISIVLIINIISRIPSDMISLWDKFVNGKNIGNAVVAAVIILAVILATIVLVVILQEAKRTIPVQYSKKVVGNKQVGGQSSQIPLKVNTAGVIPVIFAQSLLTTPVIIASLIGKSEGTGIGHKILRGLSQSNWCNPNQPIYSIGLVVYILLIIAFAYFYTEISFNPLEVANNMKKQGGFIPGIRPGKPTSDYLTNMLKYIVFIGAVGLVIVSVIPIIFNGVFKADVSFGGTSLIIIVGVVVETLNQIESQMRVRNYKGFLKD